MMSNNPISSLPQQNAPSSQPTLAKRRSSAGGQIAGNRGDNHTPTPTTSQQTGHQDNSHQYSQKHMASNQKAIARPHTANLVSRSARNSNPNLSNRAQSTTSSDVYENTERTPTGNQANGNFHQVRGHSSESVTRKDYQKAPFNHRSSLSTTAQKPPNFFSSKKSSLQRTT